MIDTDYNPDEFKTLTWKEFKEAVDREIEKLGLSESPEIFYIDVHMPYRREPINVIVGRDGLIAIS